LKVKEDKEAAKSVTKRKGSDEGSRDGKKQTKLSFGVPDVALTMKIVEAVVSFIAETGTAFRVVGQPSFKNLMNVANNRVQLKDSKTYSRMTGVKAQEISKEINDIVQTVKDDLCSVGFTTDIWTSQG
jgi:ABC-type Fe3+-citrate transport system substrate-binding protein